MSNEGMTRLVVFGIIARLQSISHGCRYRVRMETLSSAYAPDYIEDMITVADLDKFIRELEEMLNDQKDA